jgi:hypothetical protein
MISDRHLRRIVRRRRRNQPRLADHVPEQGPREPTPRQEPPPELADRCPLPFAFELPEETLTVTAPLLDTLPVTAPETTPSWIWTPKLELGSQAPRCVLICTVQLPSKGEAACAVSIVAAAAITTVATITTLESEIVSMAATFGDEFHNLMT